MVSDLRSFVVVWEGKVFPSTFVPVPCVGSPSRPDDLCHSSSILDLFTVTGTLIR